MVAHLHFDTLRACQKGLDLGKAFRLDMESMKYFSVKNISNLGILFGMLAGSVCDGFATSLPKAPRLVVFISVDGFRYDLLNRFESQFVRGGFRLLLDRGANLTQCSIDHIRPSTGPGHTTMLTGAYGRDSGIVENEWWDRTLKRNVNCVEDISALILDGSTEKIKRLETDGRSPQNLMVTTVGDELRLSNHFQSKVIGISIKDRAAMLTSGKLANAAYWYDPMTGHFVTSNYYMKQLPGWVKDFNNRRIPHSFFGAEWDRLLPERQYHLSRKDDYPHESDYRGLGRTFPHPINGKLEKPGQAFFEAFSNTPFGDSMLSQFAREVIDNEGLGRDEITDILIIGFYSTDKIGHLYGAFSQEMQDQILRLDRILEELFSYLNKKVGLSKVAIVLTADHGSTAIPEYLAEHGVSAGRIDPKTGSNHASGDLLKSTVDHSLDKQFGEADWITAFNKPNLYLNLEAITSKNLSNEEVEKTAAEALKSIKGIRRAYTRSEILANSLFNDSTGLKFSHQFHPKRSGELMIANEPYYILGGYDDTLDQGTGHETGYRYDIHIPLLFYGKSIRPGNYRIPVIMNDIAPTVAGILNSAVPPGSSGKVIHQIFR